MNGAQQRGDRFGPLFAVEQERARAVHALNIRAYRITKGQGYDKPTLISEGISEKDDVFHQAQLFSALTLLEQLPVRAVQVTGRVDRARSVGRMSVHRHRTLPWPSECARLCIRPAEYC